MVWRDQCGLAAVGRRGVPAAQRRLVPAAAASGLVVLGFGRYLGAAAILACPVVSRHELRSGAGLAGGGIIGRGHGIFA